jgi:hypothetical protein
MRMPTFEVLSLFYQPQRVAAGVCGHSSITPHSPGSDGGIWGQTPAVKHHSPWATATYGVARAPMSPSNLQSP